MNFGQALELLKEGKQVSRAGWNGKGMWLYLIDSTCYQVEGLGFFDQLGKDNPILRLPWIGMKTADNKFVPWLASQTDVLAEDWGVI